MDLIQLSKDLAQKAIMADLCDVMIHGASGKAKAIRDLSENNAEPGNTLVQDFRKYYRVIFIALTALQDFGLLQGSCPKCGESRKDEQDYFGPDPDYQR